MTSQSDDGRRALEEAALLPEDDSRRREVVDALEDTGADRQAWCDILAENEDLRLRLRSVEAPAGLLERVRSIRGPIEPASHRRRALLGSIVVAATILLVVTVGLLVLRSDVPADSATYELATLAAMDHAARPEMTIKTDDLATLAEALDDQLPFDFSITRPEPGAVLIGGRLCTFGDRPLVYTCWRIDGKEVAMYQVRRSEFGLVAGESRREMDIPAEGSRESRCWTCVWTDAQFAYVLVRDQKSSAG